MVCSFHSGMFMAQQERVIACGAGLAALGLALRFVAGPLATLVGAAAFGLRGDVLRFAIIQVRAPCACGVCRRTALLCPFFRSERPRLLSVST